MTAREYAIRRPDVRCSECCTPSEVEPVRQLATDGEPMYLCMECDGLLDEEIAELFEDMGRRR